MASTLYQKWLFIWEHGVFKETENEPKTDWWKGRGRRGLVDAEGLQNGPKMNREMGRFWTGKRVKNEALYRKIVH